MTQDYYGTKRVTAWPAEKDGVPGYGVRYPNNYTSWSPAEAFEAAYQPITSMSFGHAIEALKAGHKVARRGWNGKGMWLILVPGTAPAYVKDGTPYHRALQTELQVGRQAGSTDIMAEILPHIDMWTTNSEGRRAMLPGWLASQTDMLASDWYIVEC